MSAFIELLNTQPFITLFLVIGVGYLVGRLSIAGFSMGVGAILFVGLGVGAIAPGAITPPLLGLIGLVLFLYGIGIQYGREFFRGLVSLQGLKTNALAVIAVIAACIVAVLCAKSMGFGIDIAAGILAGSLSSTSTLQAAMDASGSTAPATGYALCYPFGILGPILCFYLAKLLFKPRISGPAHKRLVLAEGLVCEHGLTGRTVAELQQQLPGGVDLLMIRHGGQNHWPKANRQLQANDLFEVVGFPDQLAELGFSQSHAVSDDRCRFDYVRAFVSNSSLIGCKISELPQPAGFKARVIKLRRGDTEFLPGENDVLEYGDQVGVLVAQEGKDALRQLFGDSLPHSQSSFDFVAHSLALALGGLIGLIPIPVPGIGGVSLGVAGGALVMALLCGYVRRLGRLDWHMPVAANLVLRKFGLAVFLAGVGLTSGQSFVQSLDSSGVLYVLAGALVLLTNVLIVLIGGYCLLRLKFGQVLGTAAGATGNPAIVAYADQLAPSGDANVLYAMIFPGAGTILKIIAVQIMLALPG